MDSIMRMPPRKPGLYFTILRPRACFSHLRAVNERSINNLKRRSLRRSMTLGLDTESQSNTGPSRLKVLLRKLKSPFTRQFWEDRFEKSDDETLVDGKVLSYAYLEVGIIETIGS